jgi:hypothetical protein
VGEKPVLLRLDYDAGHGMGFLLAGRVAGAQRSELEFSQ